MKKVKLFGILFLLLSFSVVVVYWFEAEKEVRILCELFTEGQSAEQVVETLNTGNLLMYSTGPNMIYVDSFCTLTTSSCTITLSDNSTVITAVYEQSFRLEQPAAWIGFGLTILLSGFQLLLALGLPLGEYAWGGKYKTLPGSLRIGSGVSVLMLLLSAFSLLSATGQFHTLPPEFAQYVVLFVTLVFLFSNIGNMLSSSTKERKIMIPVSILLYCSYIIVTASSL